MPVRSRSSAKRATLSTAAPWCSICPSIASIAMPCTSAQMNAGQLQRIVAAQVARLLLRDDGIDERLERAGRFLRSSSGSVTPLTNPPNITR